MFTETDYVRGTLAAYGNDLLSLGVDGFRLDAAKSSMGAICSIATVADTNFDRYQRV